MSRQTFEVTWEMFGTAKVQADTLEGAVELVSDELGSWTGTGLDLDEVQVDGTDVEA